MSSGDRRHGVLRGHGDRGAVVRRGGRGGDLKNLWLSLDDFCEAGGATFHGVQVVRCGSGVWEVSALPEAVERAGADPSRLVGGLGSMVSPAEQRPVRPWRPARFRVHGVYPRIVERKRGPMLGAT